MATYLIFLLSLATFANNYLKLHVKGHPLINKDIEIATTTEIHDELTTISYHLKNTTMISGNVGSTTLDLSSFHTNRSLYDELKAQESTMNPLFTSPFNNSSEFSSVFDIKSRNKNDVEVETSLERMFKENEKEFRNNSTKEEHHQIDKINIENSTLIYSSKNKNFTTNLSTNNDKENKTATNIENKEGNEIIITELPISLNKTSTSITAAVMSKKGKYLDLMPPAEGNLNSSLPNSPEVWALASMREVDERKKFSDDIRNLNSSDVELLNEKMMNNPVKSLLDFSEIAKLDNNSNDASIENVNKSSSVNDITSQEDAATAENKEVTISTSSQLLPTTASTIKSTVDDDRIELEHENAEVMANKSKPVISKIDMDLFRPTSDLNNNNNSNNNQSMKSQENRDHHEVDDDVELIAPLNNNRNDNGKRNKNEKIIKITEQDVPNETTTDSSENFTTPASSLLHEEATTMESVVETTTSNSLDNAVTLLGEEMDDDNDEMEGGGEVYKRTITEMPDLKTEEFSTTTTQMPISTTTEGPSTAFTEEPITAQTITITEQPKTTPITEILTRSTLVTKSISIRIATTTTERPEDIHTTISDMADILTTVHSHRMSTEYYENYPSTSNSPIEIDDDEKFKYNTLLPEVSTTIKVTSRDTPRSSKNGGVEETSSTKDSDLNKESLDGDSSNSNIAIISISISIIVFLLLVAGGFLLFKKRKKQLTYGQRCRPVGLDAYSLDNVSVYNSVRRKANALRLSKRSYGNSAFEDPSLQSNVLDYQSLQDFAKNKTSIHDEFKEIPQVSVRVDEVPENCEDKNRYANVVPLPETRVHLQKLNDDEKTEYINANFVKGPKDNSNYYIATQAPLENTVGDFWRMIWEQNSKVIVMVTDLTENGVERCAEYIPASIVLDNTLTFGEFQVTLKCREVKGKYAVSQLHVKNLKTNTWREIVHLWYSWPEIGCPTDESSIISMLLEARGYLRSSLPEHLDENSNSENNNNVNDKDKLSTLDKTKSLQRVQGPLTVHCSPGTGRTGTLIACDIVLRMLEIPPKQIDIPQIVYHVRRGRANAVRTKDQYEFIYCIANAYATKLNSAPTET